MVEVPKEEYEWLLHSAKRAWLIVYTYDAMLHVLKEPFIFLHSYDPSTDEKTFTAIYDAGGSSKHFQVKFKIDDYMPHEIEGMVKLAAAAADVWRP